MNLQILILGGDNPISMVLGLSGDFPRPFLRVAVLPESGPIGARHHMVLIGVPEGCNFNRDALTVATSACFIGQRLDDYF